MKNVTFIFILLGLLVIFNSCDDNDGFLELSPENEQLADDGIRFNFGGGSRTIGFRFTGDSKAICSIDYINLQGDEWLNIEEWNEGIQYTIKLECSMNRGTDGREAVLEIKAGKASRLIKIFQSPTPHSETDGNYFVFGSEACHKDIRIKSNGKLSSLAVFDKPTWIKHEIIEDNGVNVLSLDIDRNNGLGRVAFIKISVDGTQTDVITLRQQPAPFPSTLEVFPSSDGQLFVLLGDDQSNYLNVRKLFISGSLNSLDLNVLGKFSISGALGEGCPLEIDMYWSRLCRGNSCYYPELNNRLPADILYGEEGELPIHWFHRASNLTSIRLPGNTKVIEDYCFSFCKNLKVIEIPDDVTTIGSGAFSLSSKLTEVIISPYTRLSSIGEQAFNGCFKISNFYLPESATQIHESAFRHCRIGTLQVEWETPPALKYGPKGDTLIVPAGCREIYADTPPWNQFANIIESE